MKNKKKIKKTNAESADNLVYPHNPHYSMIYPDAEKRDDDSITTGNES